MSDNTVPRNEVEVWRGKFIQIVDEGIPFKTKTHVYRVEARWDSVDATQEPPILGTVKWFGRWRCYAFFPSQQTVYETTCLRDIADFCQDMTTSHKMSG